MANHLRYIRRRANGVSYYERRVPKAVRERPDEWRTHFGGKALYRASLRTKSQPEALLAGRSEHERFESRYQAALGQKSALTETGDNTTRPVTPAALDRIRADARERVVRPWAQDR